VRQFFDRMMELGVEGMMVSPGYPYEKAPDQQHFLPRKQTEALFRAIFARDGDKTPSRGPSANKPRWRFNQTPIFLEYLMGQFDLECSPWASPTYNLFGWQRPCYLIDEGYCQSFAELMETTPWERYGRASG